MVRVGDLMVREGGRSTLSTDNIAVAISLAGTDDEVAAGDDGLVFSVMEAPSHGQLLLTSEDESRPHDRAAVIFTLADIKRQRVVYEHDGSDEATSDSFGLELQLTSSAGSGIPPASAGGEERRTYAFSVVVQIEARNDRPVIWLPANDTLHIIAGRQRSYTELHYTARYLRRSVL